MYLAVVEASRPQLARNAIHHPCCQTQATAQEEKFQPKDSKEDATQRFKGRCNSKIETVPSFSSLQMTYAHFPMLSETQIFILFN